MSNHDFVPGIMVKVLRLRPGVTGFVSYSTVIPIETWENAVYVGCSRSGLHPIVRWPNGQEEALEYWEYIR